MGWVHRRRDLGQLIFIDLRDRAGIAQIVFNKEQNPEAHARAEELRSEFVAAVEGRVVKRQKSNPEISTGEVEVIATKLHILNNSKTPPFQIEDEVTANEETRLRHRYLDLRRPKLHSNIELRHRIVFEIRKTLDEQGFFEIETPLLTRSTPEGARDCLVPSRIHHGQFYALPQSPQIFKQILMISGMDRYFQICKCIRDEDFRADRQLEFTQLDLEMSFPRQADIFDAIERVMQRVCALVGVKVERPFRHMEYKDALRRYGSDKPDLRFGLEMKDFAPFAAKGGFEVFKKVVEGGGVVKALVAPGCGEYSRKQITDLESVAKIYGAAGLAWMKVTAAGLEGGVAKFYADQAAGITGALGAKPGDLILMVGAEFRKACVSLGAVRTQLGKDLKLADPNEFKFCWIIDFPLFEWNEEEKNWDPAHHMFTMPQERFLADFEKRPGEVKGDLYDLVCNGVELASGSIRIHDPELQKRIFRFLGFSEELAQQRFGFLLEAFRYGPPPHGGIAPGFDRLVAMMAGEPTIREVITFPKNTLGQCPMDDSPSPVDPKQLEDLSIRVIEKKQ